MKTLKVKEEDIQKVGISLAWVKSFNAQMFILLGYKIETQPAPHKFGSSLVEVFESFLNFSGHVQIGEILRQTPNTSRMAEKF